MRLAIGIVITTLTLGLGHGPALAQTGAGWLHSIHMFDALTGWAVEAEGGSGVVAKGAVESVVRTTDGGIHWRDVTPHAPPGGKIALGQGSAFRVDWLNSFVAWVAAALDTPTHDTMLFRTVDGGRTWRIAPTPVVGLFQFVNTREGWTLSIEGSIARENQAAIYHSTDGGETWTKIASARFPGAYPEITFLSATTGWVAPGATDDPEKISPYVTHDGGYTWQQQKLPLPPGEVPFRVAVTMPPTFFTARDGILPVSVSRFVFYLTHDGGITWTYATPIPVTQWGPFSFADVNHGWVTDGDALLVTRDGGRQWTTIRPGPPFTHVGELDFISPQVGWAAGRPLFLPVLLKTQDGGRTWKSLPYTISR